MRIPFLATITALMLLTSWLGCSEDSKIVTGLVQDVESEEESGQKIDQIPSGVRSVTQEILISVHNSAFYTRIRDIYVQKCDFSSHGNHLSNGSLVLGRYNWYCDVGGENAVPASLVPGLDKGVRYRIYHGDSQGKTLSNNVIYYQMAQSGSLGEYVAIDYDTDQKTFTLVDAAGSYPDFLDQFEIVSRVDESYISISTPTGGSSYGPGETVPIKWSSVGPIRKVNILYSTNGGSNWTAIASSVTNTQCGSVTYNWEPTITSSNVKVKVEASDYDDAQYDAVSGISQAFETIAPLNFSVYLAGPSALAKPEQGTFTASVSGAPSGNRTYVWEFSTRPVGGESWTNWATVRTVTKTSNTDTRSMIMGIYDVRQRVKVTVNGTTKTSNTKYTWYDGGFGM